METYKIVRVKDGSFDGDDGRVNYSWVKAKRIRDGVTVEFGTRKDYSTLINSEVELDLEKTEKPGGGFRYKEIIES